MAGKRKQHVSYDEEADEADADDAASDAGGGGAMDVDADVAVRRAPPRRPSLVAPCCETDQWMARWRGSQVDLDGGAEADGRASTPRAGRTGSSSPATPAASAASVPVADSHVVSMTTAKDGTVCELCLHYPLDDRKLLMASVVEAVAAKAVLREVPGIARCFIEENEKPEDNRILLATEGVNLRGLWDFADDVDIQRLGSNDIRAILSTYGVEAARNTIVREIGRVFGVYGISVDTRHLSLVADAMV